MRLLLVAPPGAGKGTQAAKLADHYGITNLSSGELLRQEIAADSEIGRKAIEYVRRGDLVPDDLIFQVLAEPLIEAARQWRLCARWLPTQPPPSRQSAYRVAREKSVHRTASRRAPQKSLSAELTRRLLARERPGRPDRRCRECRDTQTRRVRRRDRAALGVLPCTPDWSWISTAIRRWTRSSRT